MGKDETGDWRQVIDDTAALLVRCAEEIATRDAEIARLREALESASHAAFRATVLIAAALQEQPNG